MWQLLISWCGPALGCPQSDLLERMSLGTHLPTPRGWTAELAGRCGKQFRQLGSNPGLPRPNPASLKSLGHTTMARKALIDVLVYEISIGNLSPVKKVVNSIFKQLQNNYSFNNILFKPIVCLDPKVRQLAIIIIKIMKGKFKESLRGGLSYKN